MCKNKFQSLEFQANSDDVGRHQIGSELNAAKLTGNRSRQLSRRRFPYPERLQSEDVA
jgi:hypothetical protein